MGIILEWNSSNWFGSELSVRKCHQGGVRAPLVMNASVRRCEATTTRGTRCSIDASCKMRDRNGRLVAEPLLRGASQCGFHLLLVATNPAENVTANDLLIVYLDFETTGLDALSDEIVEFGAVAANCGARFASTVQPLKLPDPEEQTVHGIGACEFETSP